MDENQNPEIDEVDDAIDPESDYYNSELGQMGETENEDEMSEMERKIFERQEQRLDRKLDKIIEKAPYRFIPFFLPWEKKTIEQAKKHKKLRPKLDKLGWLMNAARMKATSKGISAITPIVTMLPIVFIVVIAIIAAAVMIAIIKGEIDLNGNSTGGNSGAAPMGPKGKDFYAVRAVYSDDEQAEIDQIGDYIDILKGVKEQIDTDIAGLEITFNLDLPEDDEINTFIENKNTGEFIIAYETMKEMANVVYLYDNESGVETELNIQLGLIKYFGYNDEIINLDGENNDLTDIVKANLEQYQSSLFAPKEDGELPADLTNIVNASVDKYMATVSDLRAEKYYIKDFVLDGDDATMEDIETKNYKAIILYSRSGFDAQFIQFYAKNVDVEKFVTYIDDFGTKIEFDIVPKDNDDYYDKTSSSGQSSNDEPENKMYNYEINHAFSIDENMEPTYLNTIVEGKNILNLYDILLAEKDNLATSTILTDAVDESGNTIEKVYSYIVDGYAIMTEYDEEFGFSMMLEKKSTY